LVFFGTTAAHCYFTAGITAALSVAAVAAHSEVYSIWAIVVTRRGNT
jgi:acyl dehydratase